MNFFNAKALAKRFQEGSVPSKERLIYFLSYLIVTAVIASYCLNHYIIFRDYKEINIYDILYDILIIILTIIGTIIVYQTNMKGDKHEFIERYICLSFPIIIQCVILSFMITAIFILITYLLPNEIITYIICKEYIDIPFLLILVSIEIYYYIMLNKSMKIASSVQKLANMEM